MQSSTVLCNAVWRSYAGVRSSRNSNTRTYLWPSDMQVLHKPSKNNFRDLSIDSFYTLMLQSASLRSPDEIFPAVIPFFVQTRNLDICYFYFARCGSSFFVSVCDVRGAKIDFYVVRNVLPGFGCWRFLLSIILAWRRAVVRCSRHSTAEYNDIEDEKGLSSWESKTVFEESIITWA
jgi:hypothetical protein